MKGSVMRVVGAAIGGVLLALALVVPSRASAGAGYATAYFAGGCYWGVEAVFRHVQGVHAAVSGFAVAVDARLPRPDGTGDYVEAVLVEYDPSKVTYAQLLDIFFLVAHDPTERDRQGPDVGPEYRSVVFVNDGVQRRVVRAYIDHLRQARRYPRPIVTEISSLERFREAPPSQQNWFTTHHDDPYVMINDVPKVATLQRLYPDRYRE